MKRNPKIVVVGGGTGTLPLLTGLKNHTSNVTALVSMADDGGSTGLLRDEYGVLPPGDVRKCLAALAREPKIRELFNYRFEEGSLAGHSFGNLFLTAVEKMTDNFGHAVELAGHVLNITGQVIPVTLDKVTLVLEQQGGKIIRGEATLDAGVVFQHKRPHVTLEPNAQLNPHAHTAIMEADMVVIAPGSLYGSLAAVLVVDGMAETLAAAPAKKVYVCNLVTEAGQTDDFTVADFASEIERFLGGKVQLEYVLYNTHKPREDLLRRYYSLERRSLVMADKTPAHYQRIGDNYIDNPAKHEATFIRHNADKIAAALLDIL